MVNFLSDPKLLFGSCFPSQKICPEQSSAEEMVSTRYWVNQYRVTGLRTPGRTKWVQLAVSFQMNRCLGENTNKSKAMFPKSISLDRFQQNMGLFFLQAVMEDTVSGNSWKSLDFVCITHRDTMLAPHSSCRSWEGMTFGNIYIGNCTGFQIKFIFLLFYFQKTDRKVLGFSLKIA